MTTEYQEQMTEYMKSQNMNPIVCSSLPLFIALPATKNLMLTLHSLNSPVSPPRATRARVWFSRVWFSPLKSDEPNHYHYKKQFHSIYVWTCFLWAQYSLCAQHNNALFS